MKQFIAHVTLVVENYDDAINFYTQKLNFRLIKDTVLNDDKRWVLVAPPGVSETCLLLAQAVNPEQRSRVGDQTGGRVALFLYTDNFTSDYATMQQNGVEFVSLPRKEAYGTVAVFKDLYGNMWDFIQPAQAR
jgi:catechol 2,3-dioxygenase-like lactoylglutathione lyase family enzyme